MLQLQPISYEEACIFIEENHSTHAPPQGWKFGVAVNDGEEVVGVATVGRPVARHNDDGWTLEVTRCCTNGHKNVASKLYAACWRAARAMGYRRLITYTLEEEEGTCLRAVGFREIARTKPGSWERESRPRVTKHPVGVKVLWEAP